MKYVNIIYVNCKTYKKDESGLINPKTLCENSYNKIVTESDSEEECFKKSEKVVKLIKESLGE